MRGTGVAGGSRCGAYEVYENRSDGTGRKMSLNLIVIPALGARVRRIRCSGSRAGLAARPRKRWDGRRISQGASE